MVDQESAAKSYYEPNPRVIFSRLQSLLKPRLLLEVDYTRMIPLTMVLRCLRLSYYEVKKPGGREPTLARFPVTQLLGIIMHDAIERALDEGCYSEVAVISFRNPSIVGIADIVCPGWVVEVKTVGYLHSNLPRLTHVLQLRYYMFWLGRRGLLWYVDRRSGDFREYRYDNPLDVKGVELIYERAKALRDAIIEGKPPEPEPGSWCSTCNWRSYCPCSGGMCRISESLERLFEFAKKK